MFPRSSVEVKRWLLTRSHLQEQRANRQPDDGALANATFLARRSFEWGFDVASSAHTDTFGHGTPGTTVEAEPTRLPTTERQSSGTRDLNTPRGREQTNTNRSENLSAWRSLSFGERVRHREGGLAQESRVSVYS